MRPDAPPAAGAPDRTAAPSGAAPGRFTQGSTMRHVVELTVTGSIGLMAIFLVDFLSLFYVSRLGNAELTAGVGYATTVLFIAISFNIGAMIAGTALVSRAIGAGNRAEARRIGASSTALTMLLAAAVTAVLLALLPLLLDRLSATGTPREVAIRFLWIALPSNILLAAGMNCSGLLRAVGDARRAMHVTLLGGLATAVLDPVLIFGLGLGTDGAAIATALSRVVFAAVGFHGAIRVHDLIARPRLADVARDARPLAGIAGPAILTQIATPAAVVLFLLIIAPYGPNAIAAAAIIDRLTPLAFGALFALSGAVGPIIGQNYGAGRLDRLRQAMRDALLLALLYTLTAWFILIVGRHWIGPIFGVTGETERYVAFFCVVGGLMWVFLGFLFVANAAFNNLGHATYSTMFNWGRATVGTLPPAWIGAQIAGVEGAMTGVTIGAVVIGIASVLFAFRTIARIQPRPA